LYLIHAAGCQHIASAKRNRNKKVRKKYCLSLKKSMRKKCVPVETKKVTAVAT